MCDLGGVSISDPCDVLVLGTGITLHLDVIRWLGRGGRVRGMVWWGAEAVRGQGEEGAGLGEGGGPEPVLVPGTCPPLAATSKAPPLKREAWREEGVRTVK